jgi:UDP-N-acetylmuramate--alanine ligase
VAARVRLPVAGRHNILNALGATAACAELGINLQKIVEGLGQFRGASRRFEYRGRFRGADLVDDYAHHPAEIEATLSAARFGPWKRVVAVFQPHLYSRTQSLWREFGTALAMADLIVVTDVYGAREQPVPGVTGKLIVDSVCESAPGRPVAYLPRLNDAARYLQAVLRPDDLVLSLGAGDITTLYDRLSGEVPARG